MKQTKLFALVAIMAILITSTPSVSFAKEKKQKNDNHGASVKAEQMLKVESKKDHSFMERILSLISKKAKAESETQLRPVISGISAPTVLAVGKTGEWSIEASDPAKGTLSYAVDWGDAPKSIFSKSVAPSFVQTTKFTHAYTTAGKYTVKFTVKNDAGLQASSSVTVKVEGSSEVSAPKISNLVVASMKPTKAVVRWDTDLKSSSMIWISETSPVNTEGSANIVRNAKVLKHKINLSSLKPNTKYYLMVGSMNKGGTTMSSEVSFTTPSSNTEQNAPVITSLVGPTTVSEGEEETVTVNAYDPKNGTLSYSVDWGDSYNMALMVLPEKAFTQSATLSHVYNDPGVYTAKFTVKNEQGLQATASMKITVTPDDTTAPVISDVKQVVGTSSATISWKTDEPSTSEVFYSTTSPVDVNSSTSVSDDALVTEHSINLTGLTSGTLYHFIIESSDATDNTYSSSEATFTTQ